MINFREIFNSNNNVIGLGIIIFLVIILVFLEKNMRDFFRDFGMIGIRTGLIVFVLSIIIYFILKFLPSYYRIFVEVISNNVIKSMIALSMLLFPC